MDAPRYTRAGTWKEGATATGRRAAAAALAGGVTVLAWLARARVTRFEVADRSMEPALHHRDYVVAVRLRNTPARGDVVVFTHPSRPALHLVKRVVGLPGETVELRGGAVGIDGAVLPEPWAGGGTVGPGRWVLGADEVLVLGDNREASAFDGRELGPLPAAAIAWKVVFRYWPAARMGRVS